jgi:hypothetical protein
VFPFNLAYPLLTCGQWCLILIALAKALVGSGERLTFCVFSGSACGGGGAATDSLTLVVVLGGEGRFRGGGRPLGRVASDRTLGVAERPRPVDDAEDAACGAASTSESDSEGGSDKGSESVSDTSPSLGTVTVEACLGFRIGLVFA